MGGGHVSAESLDADELDVLIEFTVRGEVKRSNSIRFVARKALFLNDGGDILGEIRTWGFALGRSDRGNREKSGRSRSGNDGSGEH